MFTKDVSVRDTWTSPTVSGCGKHREEGLTQRSRRFLTDVGRGGCDDTTVEYGSSDTNSSLKVGR